MKKHLLLILILAIGILAISGLVILLNNKVPDDYIAVFHGESGTITYETYIYKRNNGRANSGFNYVNVTSSKENKKITKHGSVQWTDDVFKVAYENNAYSYVTLPNNNKKYTIEEYMKMFLMN